MSTFPQIVSCDCGQVKFRAATEPVITAVCYCTDCQAAGDIIDDFEDAKPFREADGGTPYVTLLKKDWQPLEGQALLHPVKLKPDSPTTRYVTTCCHSPLFVIFKPGFWASTYRARYDDPPKAEWRNKTARRKSDLPFPDDIPRFKGFPLRLFVRLLKARFLRG